MLQIFSWEAKTPICLETPEPHEQRTYLKEKIFDALRTIHREFSPGQLQALFRPFKRDLQKIDADLPQLKGATDLTKPFLQKKL